MLSSNITAANDQLRSEWKTNQLNGICLVVITKAILLKVPMFAWMCNVFLAIQFHCSTKAIPVHALQLIVKYRKISLENFRISYLIAKTNWRGIGVEGICNNCQQSHIENTNNWNWKTLHFKTTNGSSH